MSAVTVQNIVKTYDKGEVVALNNISLDVKQGELFGLIGPDGAGKTSLFRILATVLQADSGMARIGNFNVETDYKSIRRQIGYMPGKFSLYLDLSVEENLTFFATLFNTSIQENYELIKDIYVQLEPFKNRRAGDLSGGMKQKLALCCALIHKPSLLLLDEPTTGVDAVSRKEFWQMLKRLKKHGITILVSTPYMDEATMCERIALIQDGNILSVDSPDNIIAKYPDPLFAVRSNDMIRLLSDLRDSSLIDRCFSFGAEHHINFSSADNNNTRILITELEAKGHLDIEIAPVKPTIEDCFIQLMN